MEYFFTLKFIFYSGFGFGGCVLAFLDGKGSSVGVGDRFFLFLLGCDGVEVLLRC